MQFKKHDLESNHYQWLTDDEKAMFNGDPSRRNFDRFNGEQVLFLINYYASMKDDFSIDDGRKLEREIVYHLPDESMSEISVINWIRDHHLAKARVADQTT